MLNKGDGYGKNRKLGVMRGGADSQQGFAQVESWSNWAVDSVFRF